MNREEIEQRVRKVICRVLKIDPSLIEPSSHFVFDLGAESTQSVELVAALEEEFGVELDDDAALAVKTVGGAVDFIAQRVG